MSSKSKLRHIGIQFFAEDGLAANTDAVDVAASEGIASPQAESQAEPTQAIQQEDVTQTQAFAHRLKEATTQAEAKARDALIAQIYGEQGITTYAEYEAALAAQEAEQKAAENNVPVEFYTRMTESERKAQEALDKLSQYERKELMTKQVESLSTDEKWGSFFNANKTEILEVAERLNTDLDTAKLLVLDSKGIPTLDTEAIKQQAIQEYLDKVKKGYKPVEGSGAASVTVQEKPKTFEDAKKASLAMFQLANSQ